jgi:hypothetical protein
MADRNPHSMMFKRLPALGACLCIGVLLMATFAQALDSCEFAPLRTTHHFCAEYSAQSGSNICLICASAHTPSLAAPVSALLASACVSDVCGLLGEFSSSALHVFALYVRPPPVQ